MRVSILRAFFVGVAVSLAIVLSAAGVNAQGKSDLQKIRDAGVVKVGAAHAPPWYNYDPSSKKWTGLLADIVLEIFKRGGIKVEFVETQWGTGVAGLQAGHFDIMGGYNATPERALAIDFTIPIGFLKNSILALKADPRLEAWASLNTPDIRLSVIDGSAVEKLMSPQLDKVTWIKTQSNDAMILEMESGRAHGFVSAAPAAYDYVAKRQKGVVYIPTPVKQQPVNIGLRKTPNPELKNWLDVTIAFITYDGTMSQIWEKHIPSAK